VAAETSVLPLSTLETVEADTPAALATWAIVTFRRCLGGVTAKRLPPARISLAYQPGSSATISEAPLRVLRQDVAGSVQGGRGRPCY
jgi:hypothetical protein